MSADQRGAERPPTLRRPRTTRPPVILDHIVPVTGMPTGPAEVWVPRSVSGGA
jgi:hypothetical protein